MKADFESWHIEYDPGDGARIMELRYADHDLLTSYPAGFKPPDRFYGEFETRPVFGYDDCFPTVDSCIYPGGDIRCRDHGELCWVEWKTEISGNNLICSAVCPCPEVNFKRTLSFSGKKLTWRFDVENNSDERSVFLHVMHALFPPVAIRSVEIPGFTSIVDEITGTPLDLKNPEEASRHLLDIRHGSFEMLLLKEIDNGSVYVGFTDGLKLKIEFDQKLFPTLGIWWNNSGYPEDGVRRSECAFEPIPGTCSDLSKSFNDGVYLSVNPGEKTCWEFRWTIKQNITLPGS